MQIIAQLTEQSYNKIVKKCVYSQLCTIKYDEADGFLK